jgi:pimeloyl-ACP methyl ester carboxylesterase
MKYAVVTFAAVLLAQAGAGTPVELPVAGGKVSATLLMPASPAAKTPVVLIIAGSGPTDRDGNSPALPGKNNSYRLLAEALAADGIASLRYDKRGIAQSVVTGLTETDLRFETFVADAASWVSFLRNDPRFSTITVVGHSEGSLIGMLAARAARADAFVSVAGVARRASDALRDQLRPQLAATPEVWKGSETILASLEAGKTVDAIPPQPILAQLYRGSVQPYLISWFKYVPATELARLTIPVAILQGTTDIQVQPSEADALHTAKADAQFALIDGMNHILKMVPADQAQQVASYSNPDLPIAPALEEAIVQRVRSLDGPDMSQPRRPLGQRASLRDTVIGEVDGAHFGIEYGRPSKRGRTIWGALVSWSRWWMPGADEATSFTTSAPIAFGSLTVPAGEYTLYTQPGESSFKLIINRETGQYHTTYNSDRDLGRVEMTLTRLATPVERVTFAIEPRAGGGGAIKLSWDDREYSAAFVVGDRR